jgi:hypothetical protein
MALKGNFTYCVGYWERLWCSPDLCEKARQNGASDKNCGGSCNCGHAFKSWCGTGKTSIPIEQRLGIQPTPTLTLTPSSTPTPTPTNILFPTTFPTATPTNIPTPTKVYFPTPTPYFRENPSKPTSFSLPQNEQPTPTVEVFSPSPFLINFPKLALPRLKINKEKTEKEVGKILDIFPQIFYQIKNVDERIELTINNFLVVFSKKIFPKDY